MSRIGRREQFVKERLAMSPSSQPSKVKFRQDLKARLRFTAGVAGLQHLHRRRVFSVCLLVFSLLL
jgi:hypothetical protein